MVMSLSPPNDLDSQVNISIFKGKRPQTKEKLAPLNLAQAKAEQKEQLANRRNSTAMSIQSRK
jgi:hypothetical protein